MPNNEVNKIIGELRLGLDGLEQDAARAKLIVEETFANMDKYGKGNPAADAGMSKMTALQAAKVKAIAEKTEAEKTAILQKGEAQREVVLKKADAVLESQAKRDLAVAERTAAQIQAVELEKAAKVSEIRSRQDINEAKAMQEIAKVEKIAATKVAIEQKTAAEIAAISSKASVSAEAEKTAILQKGEAQRDAILKKTDAALESQAKRDLAVVEKATTQRETIEMESAAKISEIRSRQNINEAKEMQEIAIVEKTAAQKEAIERESAARIAEINSRASISDEKALAEVAKYERTAAEKVGIEQVTNAKVQALRDMTEVSTQEKIAKTMAYVDKTNSAKVNSEEFTQAKIEALNKKTNAQIEAMQNKSMSNMEHRHNTMLGRLQSSIMHHLGFMASGAVVMGLGLPMYEGLVKVESGMAGVAQVLPQLEGDQRLLNQVSEEYINIMQRYGANVQEVTDGAKLWGRQYKDIQTVQNLVNSTTLLSIVDNLDLAKSNQALEATMNQYGMTARNASEAQAYSMRIVDSWSNIAHNAQVSALDLADANERSASVAHKVGVEYDYLQGHITAAVRATGMPGANIGNMLKSVYGSIHSKNAVEEIEALGVKMKQTGKDGVESWRPVQEVIMDIIFATRGAKMDTEELTKSMAGGKFQWAKLAAMMGDFDTMVKATALSIHSQGKTLEYAQIQMDTIDRKAKQLKATLVDLFNEGGNDGLRTGLKATIDTLNQFIMGLKEVEPYAVKLAGLGAVGWGLVTVWKTMFTTLSPLVSSIVAARAATATLAVAETAEAAAAVTATGAMGGLAIATGVATFGLSLLVGGIAAWIYKAGEAEKKEVELKTAFEDEIAINQQKATQYHQEADFLNNATGYREKLITKIKDEKLSSNDLKKTKQDLAAVEGSMKIIVGEEAWARIQASKDKNKAMQDEINKIKDLEKAVKDASVKKINTEIETTNRTITETNKRIGAYQTEIQALMSKSNVKQYYDSLAQTKSALNEAAAKDPYFAMRISPPKSVAPLIQKTGDLYNSEDVKKMTDLQAKKAADDKTLQSAVKQLETSKKRLMDLMGAQIPGGNDPNPTASGAGSPGGGTTKTAAEKARDTAQAYVEAVQSAIHPYELSVERAANAVSVLSTREQILQKQMESGLGTSNTANELLKVRRQLYTENSKQLSGYTWQQAALKSQADQERAKLVDLGNQLKVAHDPEVVKTLKQEIENLNRSIAQAGEQYLQLDLQKIDVLNRIKDAEKAAADAIKAHQEAEVKRWDSAYQSANDFMRHAVNMGRWSTDQQIEFYEKLRQAHNWTQQQMWDTEENLYRLRKQQLDDYMSDMEKAYQSQVDAVDSKLKTTVDGLQSQIDALDQTDKTDGRENSERDHNESILKLREQLAYEQARTGKDHRQKEKDLKAQIEEENRKWQQQQDQWAVDDQKANLQKQINDAQTAADTEKKNLENHYKQVVNIANQGALDTLAALAATDPKWLEVGKTWIQNLMNGIASKGADFQAVVDEATSAMGGYEAQVPSPTGSGSSGSTSPSGAVDEAVKNKVGITIGPGDYQLMGDTAVMQSRALGDRLGESVNWDNVKKQVEIGNKWFTPKRNDNGTTYVGVREVAEKLGYTVEWDPSKRDMDIYKAANGGIFMDPSTIQVAEAGYPEVVLPLQNLQPMINTAVRFAFKSDGSVFDKAADRIIKALGDGGGDVNLYGPLFNAEKANFSDELDVETTGRQLFRAARSIGRVKGV